MTKVTMLTLKLFGIRSTNDQTFYDDPIRPNTNYDQSTHGDPRIICYYFD